jgi:nucleosome binding factor SPN SPT16 subunit
MGLCAACNLDGRNLGESLETFSQLKKETRKRERERHTHTHTHTNKKLMQVLQLMAPYIYTYLRTQDLL